MEQKAGPLCRIGTCHQVIYNRKESWGNEGQGIWYHSLPGTQQHLDLSGSRKTAVALISITRKFQKICLLRNIISQQLSFEPCDCWDIYMSGLTPKLFIPAANT